MEPDLTKTLRQKVEAGVREALTKMWNGESKALTFEPDFHGDTVLITIVKGYSNNKIDHFKVYHRASESGRYDGFDVDRDLEWTINATLSDLGL